MKYYLLMYADEKAGEALAGNRPVAERMTAIMRGDNKGGEKKTGQAAPKDEMDMWVEKIMAYYGDLQKAGVLVKSEALHPTSAAVTVRVRDGKKLTTHGPFAETKEQLGGIYIIDCKNLDEAIEWAAKAPMSQFGSVEVRPVRELG